MLIGGQATSKLSLKSPMKIVLMLKPQSDSTYVLLLFSVEDSFTDFGAFFEKGLYTEKVIFKLQELQIWMMYHQLSCYMKLKW